MSNYDESVVEAAKNLVKAKVRWKGKPRSRAWTDQYGEHHEVLIRGSWTDAEYALYVAVMSGDT